MKPIKLYFAGDWAGIEDNQRNKIDGNVSHRLVSYAYPKLLQNWLDITGDKEGSILVDSGAFSIWNKGYKVDLNDYIKYCHKAISMGKKQNKDIHIVNLDVIPGEVGGTRNLQRIRKAENLEIIENAAKQGYLNMKKMIRAGLKPIPVFHQGESLKWLERMLQYTNYIGVSPANDLPSKARNKWMEFIFDFLYKNNAKVDVHGFAVTSPKILRDLPWRSCDSATWRLTAAKGTIFYPRGGFLNADYNMIDSLYVSSRKGNEVGKTQMKWLERDGYILDDLQTFERRAMFNIRFFLEFEKWLNEEKKKQEFKPKRKQLL